MNANTIGADPIVSLALVTRDNWYHLMASQSIQALSCFSLTERFRLLLVRSKLNKAIPIPWAHNEGMHRQSERRKIYRGQIHSFIHSHAVRWVGTWMAPWVRPCLLARFLAGSPSMRGEQTDWAGCQSFLLWPAVETRGLTDSPPRKAGRNVVGREAREEEPPPPLP